MSSLIKLWHYLLIFILFSGLSALGIVSQQTVMAENSTMLSVLPSEGQVFINGLNTFDAQISISNVTNLNAFDITLTYDKNLLSVTSWSHGGFLTSLYCPSRVNDPGYFRLACTQRAQPGANGDGSLINLTFTGISAGGSPVTIDSATLADTSSPSEIIPTQRQHGFITVSYHTAQVTGAIALQGQSNRAGVPASLGTGTLFLQGPYDTLSLPNQGTNLDFGLVVTGDTYTMTTDQPRYLNLVRTLTLSADLALPPLRLLAGDVTGDNAVTTADLDAIRSAFGTHGHGLAADLNNDGVVDLRDLALAGGNFGLTAQEAYADWLE